MIRGESNNTTEKAQLLTVEDVAGLLKLHVRSVWRAASAGLLPKPIKVGGSTRWRLVDIQAYIEDQIGGEK